MKKLPKILLMISVLTSVIGSVIWFCPIKVAPQWTVIMPIGPVSFGLFLITLALEKEMAQYDKEAARQPEPIHQHEAGHRKCKKCTKCQCQP